MDGAMLLKSALKNYRSPSPGEDTDIDGISTANLLVS